MVRNLFLDNSLQKLTPSLIADDLPLLHDRLVLAKGVRKGSTVRLDAAEPALQIISRIEIERAADLTFFEQPLILQVQ